MEYNINFEDNIFPSEFNSRALNIKNWIQENRQNEWGKDPNAYELTNLFLFAGKYIEEGEDINIDTIKDIWNLREKDFEGCNISKNHFVYQICKQSYEAAISNKSLVNDEQSHSVLRKIAGIGLNLMQQERDNGKMDYNNFGELYQLIKNSTTLKEKQPDLHNRLRCSEIIQKLYRKQMEHLDEHSKSELTDVYNNYTTNKLKSQNDDNDIDNR